MVDTAGFGLKALSQIHRPSAVRYWVDDGDWQTKRALATIMFFFTLEEGAGANDKLPLVTIPAQ